MEDRVISKRLFWQTPVSGTAVSGPQSSALDLRMGAAQLQSITFMLSSVVSTPDVGIFYAFSQDGVTWGSYADNAAIQTSTFSGGNPQGYHAVGAPTVLAPFVRFSISGTGSNPQDSLATLDVILRMSQ